MGDSPPVNASPPASDRAAQPEGTSVSGGTIRALIRGGHLCALLLAIGWTSAPTTVGATEPTGLFTLPTGSPSPYDQRQELIASLPLQRLTPDAQQRILSIANSPTLYRRLPTQAIACDREMFLFLARNPEVLVGIWDLMGITKVQTTRTGPYQFDAEDGSGTKCHVDLVYGDPSMHVYVADGSYDGKLVAAPIRGRGVFVLRSSYAEGAQGQTTVTGTIDCFVQIENLGADLIARTLSGLIGRSADHNFIETARFMAQVSQASELNAPAMIDVATRMPQVNEGTRREFVRLIMKLADKGSASTLQTAGIPLPSESR